MELQFWHWVGLMIIIVIASAYIYTLWDDNRRYKAIIDMHINDSASESFGEDTATAPTTTRKLNPISLDD